MRRTWLVLGLAAALAGCGGAATTARTAPRAGATAAKVDPVKPQARKEFDAAMRAARGGRDDDRRKAQTRLRAALIADPSLWEAWHNLGVLSGQDGDDGDAVTSFTRALELRPTHVVSRLARGEAYRRLGRGRDARGDYEKSLRELSDDDPLRRQAAARLASLLRDGRNYDDAIAVLRETLRVSGASSRIYTELGLVYLAQARLDLAALVLVRARELDERDPAVYNAQALLALRLGKAQEAFDRFDHAASLDPNYVDARFNKAAVLLDAGDYGRAKVELTGMLGKRPDDLAAQVALGVALRGLDDLDGARAVWERVIKNAPRRSTARADALFNLVILRADFQEDPAKAKAELERYLQDAPDNHAKRQAADEKRKELGL
jgi:tetratricopeptide (TPR) repeat protein